MPITNGTKEDIQDIIPLFQSFFPKHNIFQLNQDQVKEYLETEMQKHQLLIIKEQETNKDKRITAASFIVKTGESSNQEHTRWKFRHFAFTNEEAGKELLAACEEYIKKQSKTAKIELTISENESSLEFFEQQGYQKEGTLTNHYRWNETCFILAKSFQSE